MALAHGIEGGAESGAEGGAEGGASWLVVAGVSVINLAIHPIAHSFGIIFDGKFQRLSLSTAEISLLIHINSGVSSVIGLLCAPVLRSCSFRAVALVGCLLASTAICLMSFSSSWLAFVLNFGLLFGMGQGILFPTTTLAISSHFKINRSLAVGLSIAASSFGPIVSPYFATFLLTQYGTSGAVLILGGISLHSIAGALWLSPAPQDNRFHRKQATCELEKSKIKELKIIHSTKDEASTQASLLITNNLHTNSEMNKEKEITWRKHPTDKRYLSFLKDFGANLAKSFDLELLQDPVYMSIALGMGISIAAEYNFCMLLPFILVDMANLDKYALATILSIQAGADITARFLTPFAANWFKWNSRAGYIFALCGSVLGRTVLAHCPHNYILIIIQALIVGFSKGLKAVFQSLVLPDYVPLEKLPAAQGIYMILNGILSVTCGPFVGYIRDVTKTYVAALYTTSAMSLFCVLLWSVEYFMKYFHTASSEQTKVTVK